MLKAVIWPGPLHAQGCPLRSRPSARVKAVRSGQGRPSIRVKAIRSGEGLPTDLVLSSIGDSRIYSCILYIPKPERVYGESTGADHRCTQFGSCIQTDCGLDLYSPMNYMCKGISLPLHTTV